MKTDEQIENALKQQSKELDLLMDSDSSLTGYLKLSLASNFSWIVKIGYVLAVALSVLMFVCGYQFFTAQPEREVFWGICLVLSFQAQVATKLWIFMQTNKNALSQELRILMLRQSV
jgi:hypothetical protein